MHECACPLGRPEYHLMFLTHLSHSTLHTSSNTEVAHSRTLLLKTFCFFSSKRFIVSCSKNSRLGKVFFCYHHKKTRKYVSRQSSASEHLYYVCKQKKNILENGDVTANLLYLGGLMSQILRENASAQIMLFRVSEIANFRSEMKESVTNKPFVCFPFQFPFILLLA